MTSDEPADLGSVTLANERALVGSLLWLPIDDVRRVLGLFTRDDLADQRHQVVVGLVEQCVANGVRPDGPNVLALARETGTIDGYRLGVFGALLVELHESVGHPGWAHVQARCVVEASIRRTVQQVAQRLEQVVVSESFPAVMHTTTEQVRVLAECVGRVQQGARDG